MLVMVKLFLSNAVNEAPGGHTWSYLSLVLPTATISELTLIDKIHNTNGRKGDETLVFLMSYLLSAVPRNKQIFM
jgi:hypothetical protein